MTTKINTISRELNDITKKAGSVWRRREIEPKDMDESAYVRQQPWYKKAEVIVPLALLGIGAAVYLYLSLHANQSCCMPTNLPVENPINPPDDIANLKLEAIQRARERAEQAIETNRVFDLFMKSYKSIT